MAYDKAREFGRDEAVRWASGKKLSKLDVTVRQQPDVAKKTALIRLLHFLRTTFEEDPLEIRLREALGISDKEDLSEARAIFEEAWLETVTDELLRMEAEAELS
jgi:hypothetical protein